MNAMRKIEGSESEVFEYHGTNTIRFKMKDWIRLTRANRGKSLFCYDRHEDR